MNAHHNLRVLKINDEILSLDIDNRIFTFKLGDISKKLLNASPIEREKFELSPSGYGIHWPLLDEDLSIDGLLGVQHKLPETHSEVSYT